MNLKSILFTLSCFMLIAGCGEETNVSSSSSSSSNPLSHQMKALEKAKNLEAELNKAVTDKLKAIDAQK